MLTREDMERLLNLPEDDQNLYVSAYLNVNPATNPRGDYFSAFRSLAKEEVEKLDHPGQKRVKEDISKIETYLKNGRPDFKKGLAIISSSALHIWEVFHLSMPFKNEVVIDKTPYLQPLSRLIEKYNNYIVALIDREHARLFNIYMGEINEYTELFTPHIPGRHKKGGFYGRDENRFRRHIDVHVYFHLKDVARHLEEMVKRGKSNHIILAGTEESITMFRETLSQEIINRIAGTFRAEMFAPVPEVLEKSMNIIKDIEKRDEEKLVEDLLTRASKNGSAAIGIDDVVSEIQAGNVHHLIYIEGLDAGGYKCTSCDFLTTQNIDKCPYCGHSMEEVEHFADYAIQRALDQGALISVVSENEKLKKAGSIGAILRY